MERARQRTIEDLQKEIEKVLLRVPDVTKGMHPEVSFRKNDRKIKKTAGAEKNWDPESGTIEVRFHPSTNPRIDEQTQPQAEAGEGPGRKQGGLADPAQDKRPPVQQQAGDPARDVVLTLQRAEQDPQLNFVSLKWFRDKYLPEQGFGWADSVEARQQAIVHAIQKKWVLTSKVPNPKAPSYPVTAIRLNRSHPGVQEILTIGGVPGYDFDPIEIPGERLSETILRARR